MTAKQKIAEYKFQDSLEGVNVIIGLHAFLFLLYLLFSEAQLQNMRPMFCLTTALIFWTARRYYNWTSYRINLSLVSLYVIICIAEWLLAGIPVIGYLQYNYRFNKGVMLDFFMAMVPYIYISLRVFLIVPLFLVTFRSKRVYQEVN